MQERYKRQISLDNFGKTGQNKLQDAKVGIIGLGGLGAILAEFLTRVGIGNLTIADFDKVEISNLHRQSLFTENDIDKLKVPIVAKKLIDINAKLNLNSKNIKVDQTNIKFFSKVDIICDASDNFKTRHCINKYCLESKKTLISAGVIGYESQISVYFPGQKIRGSSLDSPCYACLFPIVRSKDSKYPKPKFSPSVLGISAANAAMLQGFEVINEILLLRESLASKLMLFSNLARSIDIIKIKKDKNCKACGQQK